MVFSLDSDTNGPLKILYGKSDIPTQVIFVEDSDNPRVTPEPGSITLLTVGCGLALKLTRRRD